MKKKMTVLICAVMLCFLFVACDLDDITEESKTDNDVTKAVQNVEDEEKGEEEEKEDKEEDKEEPTPTEEEEPEKEPEQDLVDGMRPEFKEAVDGYEAFMEEYCDFMKKFNESPDDLTLLGEYAEFLTQYTEVAEDIEALGESVMNDAEAKYYLEASARINQMLLEVAE